jgi:hypothetical protein
LGGDACRARRRTTHRRPHQHLTLDGFPTCVRPVVFRADPAQLDSRATGWSVVEALAR